MKKTKIFYPQQKLNTQDTPLAKGNVNILAYFAPWGDVRKNELLNYNE